MTLLWALAAAAQAAPAAPATADAAATSGDDIVVTAAPGRLDLPRLVAAQRAYADGRAAFAPDSRFWFQLRQRGDVVLAGMTLTLRQGDRTIPVPVDGDGRFVLPAIPPGAWQLTHNRGAGRIAVRARVFSAGASEEDRPLGDLRLECRANIEILKPTLSFFQRAALGAVGGCASSRVAFYFRTPRRPIVSATATAGPRVVPLPLSRDAASYRAPLADRSLPNAARVAIRY